MDTITAVATAQGMAGIAIIRTSGKLAVGICNNIFQPQKPLVRMVSRRLYYGMIISPATGKLLDIALVCLMRAPNSYTGEDVFEIYAHGSPFITDGILEVIVSQGARIATAGEFTRRALLNGKIDALQAEAIGDLIRARSPLMADVSLQNVHGVLSQKIEKIRNSLEEKLATVEATIDFSEEEISIDKKAFADELQDLFVEVKRLSETYNEGKLLSGGISCLLIGRPNVGKSSLFNALLKKRRSIVSVDAGTTRDFIEESVLFKGLEFRFIDTAGIRKAKSDVEQQGIDVAWENLSRADIAILILDGSEALTKTDLEIAQRLQDKNFVVAINKSDLPMLLTATTMEEFSSSHPFIRISAKNGQGVSELLDTIYKLARASDYTAEISGEIISKEQHKATLEQVSFFILRAIQNNGHYDEIIAHDLREALKNITSLTNPSDNEDILQRIFENFCIGK
ncbi:MAG: tRNA uridine-5-carboxymethylaminomethyl(34) synthesis GTPase MnmE [Deltaproteobacteria bacterium]|nr:tRNA uridine-5-carboxymethylaminomethyl(34) synthesis GTPase MnmE [Deltaproteobacteria bacterium]